MILRPRQRPFRMRAAPAAGMDAARPSGAGAAGQPGRNRTPDVVPPPTVAATLRAAAARLAHLPEPRLEAERLLAHALGVERASLLASGREPVGPAAQWAFLVLVERRVGGEPLAYLLESWWFGDVQLTITPEVLIPRPETELLARWAVAWCRAQPQALRVLDVGTGSGALAVAIAIGAPNTTVTATDVSRPALAVARQNVERHRLAERVRLEETDLLPAGGGAFDLVVANLPYVGLDDRDLAAEVAMWEPHSALFAGRDGLDLIRRLLAQAPARLRPGGALGLEIGWRQGADVLRLARAAFPDAVVELRADLAGQDRLVLVERLG